MRGRKGSGEKVPAAKSEIPRSRSVPPQSGRREQSPKEGSTSWERDELQANCPEKKERGKSSNKFLRLSS